jgi:ABC-type transporter Mla subunit MlaD
MPDEEMQRTMRFILEQQAQLAVSMGQLTGKVGQLSGTIDQFSGTVELLSQKVDRTADGVAALLTIAEIHEREITAVSEARTQTDERLNAFINTVERYISERRNGNA